MAGAIAAAGNDTVYRAIAGSLVGAGGLGSPALLYLAAGGVGTLGVVDSDEVELVNLQRQVLHATDRVGQPKTDSAIAGSAVNRRLLPIVRRPGAMPDLGS